LRNCLFVVVGELGSLDLVIVLDRFELVFETGGLS